MAQVSKSQIASLLLKDLGAPDNKYTNAAVVVWLNHESGANIIGNNPWNIHQDVALSYGIHPSGKPWYSQGDGTYVAGFGSIEEGVQATATILNKNIHGYRKASDALRANNPAGFLTAIAASDWAGSNYKSAGGGPGLVAEFQKLVGSTGPVGPTGPSGGGNVGGSGNLPAPPQSTLADFLGHDGTLTLADIPAIAAQIAATLFAKNHNLTVNDIRAYLVDFVGHKYSEIPLNTTDMDQNINYSGPAGGSPPGGDVDVGLPNIDYAAVNSALAYIADPAHWLYIAALLVGVGLTGYGIITLVRAYGAPVPIPVPTPS